MQKLSQWKLMISGMHDLEPSRPEIITSDIEVFSFYDKMDPREYLTALIDGEYVLVEDYFYNGLQILEQLRKRLKSNHNNTFQGQRKYRAAYREASRRLLVMVSNGKLNVRKAPAIGWLKILYPEHPKFVMSFPDAQGLNSSWQWYTKGLKIKFLDLKLHPYYGVYFPTRFDHIHLFDQWLKQYEGEKHSAIDVGVGSGILSFQLLQNGFAKVLGTDINKNAIISSSLDSERLEYSDRLTLMHGDLFADSDWKSELIVFNPPWLPAQHKLKKGIDKAIYYNSSLFSRFFKKAKDHLHQDGKIVLLFSNLSKVVGEELVHPVKKELQNARRFRKEKYLYQRVEPASKKTKRKNWRKNERVELWELSHR